ncbi:MAG: hypothetical protein IJD71_02780 [Clostridia bacterium]|nr:hypothetical protein [Clostridia bacterium]
MKKILCLFCLVFSMLMLTACGSDANQISVAEAGYICDGNVIYGENFSCKITANAVGGGIFSLKINEPSNIAGLTYFFDNSEMSVSYGELKGDTAVPLEYGGFAEILNEIFLKFTTSVPTVIQKNGKYLYEGNNAKYKFTVVFNEQGFPLSITVDKENLVATFSNWRYK